MTTIADQRVRADAKKTLAILEEAGYRAMLAGGCVRDRLLGIVPKDYDIATTAEPPAVCKIFEQKSVKAVPTGLEHGTITIVMPSGPLEITTLRKDVATDGRRATVAFSQDFKEDAQRRDFTINAMYEDREGKVHDFFSGQEDLKNGVIQFVGDPHTRIKEDYLRILRLYRFWSRFGFQPAPDSLSACEQLCAGIEHLSQERVTSELLQIFAGNFAGEALASMVQSKVWEHCIPIEQKNVNITALAQINTTHNQGLARMISCFLQSPPQPSEPAITSLKLDGQSASAIRSALARLPHMPRQGSSPAEMMAWIDELETSKYLWLDFFGPIALHTPNIYSKRARDLLRFEETKGALRRKDPPLTGKDLRKLGFQPGPEMGKLLNNLRIAYRNEEWSSKDQGIEWLKTQAGSQS